MKGTGMVGRDAQLVLVVDSDDQTREMFAEWLSYMGYHVVQASRMKEALDKVKTLHPSVVTTGISLPDGDGCELCDYLKHNDGTKQIPVLVVTAWAFGGHIERAKRAGCDGVLTKPCPPNVLLSEIRRLLHVLPAA